MNTPIVDFVKKYVNSDTTRFHMPGHKGHVFFGCEPYDITEIKGADVLYHGEGIIAESEKNAAMLFGSGATHYSTCGSTTCIKAMLTILRMESKGKVDSSKRQYILAARNVHRSMIDACALLDLDVDFIYGKESKNLCSCVVTPEVLEETLQRKDKLPLGVYVTSPDYLGQITDIAGLVKVCNKWKLPLLVDNAHGAYLHFLEDRKHPMDLGAAMCCDSAHKTLPALTGAAYLHIHSEYIKRFETYASQAMSLFSTTSPSYITMQSLDLCNVILADGYSEKLKKLTMQIDLLKEKMKKQGICVIKSEELKIIVDTSKNGYTGKEIADEMREFGIECEYADWQNVVLMASTENSEKDWKKIREWSKDTKLVQKKKEALQTKTLSTNKPCRALSIRDAVLLPSETIPVSKALHRICAVQTVSCPPAIPIAVSGERISQEMIEEFIKFGITKISVVKKQVL